MNYLNESKTVYPSELKIWPIDGIESRPKSTAAGFVNDSVLINTGSFTIVDFERFEPVYRPNFEFTWVYLCFGEYMYVF